MAKTVKKTITTYEAINALDYIENELTKKEMPIKMAWDMRKNINRLAEIRSTYDEFYKELQEKYMDDEHSEDVTDDDGNKSRMVKSEYIDVFAKEQTDILSVENEIDIRQFNIDEFGDGIRVSLPDIYRFSLFIADDEDETEE